MKKFVTQREGINLIAVVGVLMLITASVKAEFVPVTNQPEPVAWCQLQRPNTTPNALPRVLIIGDSISGGYFGGVAEELKGKASVVRLGTSKSLGEPGCIEYLRTLLERKGLLGNDKFEVIHFNNGMHGWFYSEDEYRRDFPKLIALLRELAPDAKLIWATTTPFRMNSPNFEQFHPLNERVKARNRIAMEFIAKQGIVTDDLYAFEKDHPEHSVDGVHFKLDARPAQAKQVARLIADALPKSSKLPDRPKLMDQQPGAETSEWCDWGVQDTIHEELPHVLIVGDEIANGYVFKVEDELKGKASVVRLMTTKALGDPSFLEEVRDLLEQKELLGKYLFDVVHFNVGMHGLNYSEDEYRAAFPKLIALLKENAPGAKLIWAATTPYRTNAPTFDQLDPKNERIQARNRIAAEFAAKEGVLIDDLYALEEGHPDRSKDGVHFSDEGKTAQSKQVAKFIAEALPPATPSGEAQSRPESLVQPPPAQPVPAKIEIAEGAFKPDWKSLQQYQCPEWFRDAKLGFWGILGPQSQAEADGWYARTMYIEGERPYLFHRKHFGHPSQFGYKDLAAQWKADRFDPDRLMELYKKAGAKYFVVLGTFHDNWDNWNSKYHRWNSVNVGPHKDFVGLWAAAAKKQGLRFGISEHLERSYSWFNTNKGSDKQGKYAGVPYDGNDPAFADLYFPPHEGSNVGYPKDPPEWWTREWFWRIRDLVDSFQPDLLYTDGAVPFEETGRSLIAHFYNANTTWHGGKLEAVYNIKDMNHRSGHDHGEYVDGIAVQDVERGGLPDIKPQPWQTDTCIGDWFYRTGFEYKSAQQVIAFLCDVVSKNGNLLLNIPLKHDGTIDADEEAVLAEMGDWIAVNGEAIYGTRPWRIFGEGPNNINTKGGTHYTESVFSKMTARDIRFTTKGATLYAIALGRPEDGKLRIRSLAKSSGPIEKVSVIGHDSQITWTQTADELIVTLPEISMNKDAIAIRISGRNLAPATSNK